MAVVPSWRDDRPTASALFFLFAGVGLITGVLEGASLYLLQASRWSGETIDYLLVPRRILYVSPLVDLVLFVALGFLAAGVCRVSRGRVSGRLILFLLFMLAVFDALSMALDRFMDVPYIAILSAGISTALMRGCWRHRDRLAAAARKFFWVLVPAVAVLFLFLRFSRLEAAEDAVAELGRPPAGAPNVLLIVMDTVRADHLSALGYSRTTTPNLDGLAAQGVLFERAISTSSWTLPAHASLLTGRFPFEHGAERRTYDGRFATLPEAFQERGYRTGAFSGNAYYFASTNGFGRGFLRFDGVFSTALDVLARTLYGRSFMMLYEEAPHSDLPGRKHADLVNAQFLGWVRKDSSRPFFAVLNYFDAHDPYLPPAPFRGKFAGSQDVGGMLNSWGERETLEHPADVKTEEEAYDGGIAYMDDRIGRLLASLKQSGLANNLLLVVVSDHGEFFGEHGLYLHKNALYLEGIHVPLLMVWPGHLPAGVRVAPPVSIARLPATLMSLVPGSDAVKFPSAPLEPLWSGTPSADPEPLILSELVANSPPPTGGPPLRTESLLSPRWHLIYTQGQKPLLFDWSRDPREQQNLAGTAQGREVVAAMMRCMQDHFALIRQPDCGLSAAELNPPPATSQPAKAAALPPPGREDSGAGLGQGPR